MDKVQFIWFASICVLVIVCYGQEVNENELLKEYAYLSEYDQMSNMDSRCFKCLCHAVTGCNLTFTCSENQGYCGPFKISKVYWIDTARVVKNPGDDPFGDTAFEDCAVDYECSTRMIKNYMLRYAKDCNSDGVTNCYDYLMVHANGGYACHRNLRRVPNGALALDRFEECWEA